MKGEKVIYLKQCMNRPGWFKPVQINQLAHYMKLKPKELFSSHLAIDWYDKEDGTKIYIIAPGLKFHNTGTEYPKDPVGTCIFLNDKFNCEIEFCKPTECKILVSERFLHLRNEVMIPGIQDEYRKERKKIALEWEEYNWFVKDLLGREPCGTDFTFTDIMERIF